MNFHNDNFNSNNNSLSLSFTGKGLYDTSNSLNNYIKTGIGFQLLSNNSNYKEFVIADTSNINSNYFASLRIAVEKSQISLKSITSNNIIQPLIINSNIFITSNIGIGKTNPIYNIDVISNINADNYFINDTNISNIFINSNNVQISLQNLSNLTNSWTKISPTTIYTNSNVGINKINPSYNLDVAGNINFTGNLSKNGVVFNNFSGKYYDLMGKPDITWINSGNNIYNINLGNVGINSSTPTQKLEVFGNINVKGNYMINGNPYGGDWEFIANKPNLHQVATTGSYLHLKDLPTSSGLAGLIVKWSDIQNPPNFALVATSGNYSDLSGKPQEFSKKYGDLSEKPDIFFKVTPTSSANIYNTNGGNVGIKNSSPAYALDVSGDINFTGNFRKNGTIYGGNWNTIENKPILRDIATTANFNDILYGKPVDYDTTWSLVKNKPNFFDFDYNKLNNIPTAFPTRWDLIQPTPPLSKIAYSGSYGDLVSNSSLPKLHNVAISGKWSDLEVDGKPVVSAVGLSGNYYDLKNLPTLFSGAWNDITNKPMLFDSNFDSLINKPYVAFTYTSVGGHINTNNSGNVGIGVGNPTSKLDVAGNINATGNININGSGFNFMKNNVAITNVTATFSDSRIKLNIADIEDTSALDKIMSVEPKNYNYIDTDERGDKNVIGFIAQQIKEVIPEAITIGEEFIPNIYKYYTIISSNMILVDDANINKIFIGNTLKLKVNNIPYIAKVIDKVNKTIKIDIEIDVKAKCLIYGLKINDFHFIDKSYIYTLNVCATQELYRRIEEQKKEIDELKLLVSKIVS
jgi:hypothetical protein